MAGHRGDKARKPSPLGEVHVDNRRRQQAKPWPHAEPVTGRVLAVRVIAFPVGPVITAPANVAAEDHHRAERRRAGTCSRDGQRAIRHSITEGEDRSRLREELETGLIPR